MNYFNTQNPKADAYYKQVVDSARLSWGFFGRAVNVYDSQRFLYAVFYFLIFKIHLKYSWAMSRVVVYADTGL